LMDDQQRRAKDLGDIRGLLCNTKPTVIGSFQTFFGINPGPSAFALARYLSTGALDMTLRSGGKVTTSFGQNVTVEVVAVGLDSEGRLVAGGNLSSIGNAGKVAVARYLTP
jgi:hypothetical protein